MAKLKILQYPNPLLKRKASKVTDFSDPTLQQTIDDMLESLQSAENCAGLSSTQLDINNPPSITVFPHPGKPQEIVCLINPEIIKAIGKRTDIEACMSIFSDVLSAQVERSEEVHVKAFDRNGKEINIEAKGFLAKLLQHEIDHLNGIIYLDRISKLKRSRMDKKIQKILEQKT